MLFRSVNLYVGGPTGTVPMTMAATASFPSDLPTANLCRSNGAAYSFELDLSATQTQVLAGEPIYVYGITPWNGYGNAKLTNSGKFTIPKSGTANTGLAAQINTGMQEAAFSALTLQAGQRVNIGSSYLAMQSDGNLVLYGPSGAQWAASQYPANGSIPGGSSCTSCYATMQSDGNLVLYGPSGAYWSSQTSGNAGAALWVTTAAPYVSVVAGAGEVLSNF